MVRILTNESGQSLLLKCPVCMLDTWRQTQDQWNEWECTSCLTPTRLLDGVMDVCPPKDSLPGIEDQKMSRILNRNAGTCDASD